MITNNIVAIDGPSGAGKSTVSKLLSKKLTLQYIDTGAMYRGLTYKLLKENIDLDNYDQLDAMLRSTKFEIKDSTLLMDGNFLGNEVRSVEIDQNVSAVAANENVRQYATNQQILIGEKAPSIIDGRDIGTVLFPNAILKIFLTADVKARASRRYIQNEKKGLSTISLWEIEDMIQQRDQLDSTRELAPLEMASDAILIDTSNYTLGEVVQVIENLYKFRRYSSQKQARDLCIPY